MMIIIYLTMSFAPLQKIIFIPTKNSVKCVEIGLKNTFLYKKNRIGKEF